MMLRYIVLFGVVIESVIPIQGAVSLDSCRAMALRNNKQMLINATRIEGAEYQREVARAAYFPSIDFVGGYTYNQKELSIFDSDQMLPVKTFNPATGSYEFSIAKNPITGEPITSPDGRPVPQEVALIPKEAMTYNTHNLFFGALTLTQPVYMGGKIKALNRITEYSTQMAEMQHQRDAEDIIYNVDVAYWQVVSLDAKERLAESYVSLLDTLSRNVKAMWREGVATRSDTLMVRVKLNQAQVDLSKVKDMLSLSRMALAQLCGLPIDSPLRLADENRQDILSATTFSPQGYDLQQVYDRRNDMRQLELGAKIAQQQSKIEFASMLPNVALIGAYTFSNPNMFNGFKRNFDGNFSVGVMVTVPLWHSGGNYYKYKAAQTNETIMQLNIADAKDKIALQVRQASFKAQEAVKTYKMTLENLASAKENLRQAQIGFREGVMTIDNVMEAQTAWLKANSECLDAQIEVQLCNTYLLKVLGLLY
ncbi:MAG: TolC family protein [Muribaculaceae bacterium]|nr:TolC family protein [Muribaculaceae bacterium]